MDAAGRAIGVGAGAEVAAAAEEGGLVSPGFGRVAAQRCWLVGEAGWEGGS